MQDALEPAAPARPADRLARTPRFDVRPLVRRPARRAPEAPSARALLLKQLLDRTIAAVLLLLLLPLLLVVAVAVKLSSPGPVLYRQRRVGLEGRRFDILKFRSMRGEGDRFTPVPGEAPGGVEGDDRRTAVGTFLRRSSLDELPQLLNVLRGDMSLVGPRPERPEFVELFADEVPGYAARHRMPVGITGLSQVRGLRGRTSIAQRAATDNEYIADWSLWLDLKVLALTIGAVLRPAE